MTTDMTVRTLDLEDLLEIVRTRPETDEVWIKVKVAQLAPSDLADDAPLPPTIYLGPFDLQ